MSERTDRPHVLLIVVDQWRGDALGVAGHPVVETPHLDALASSGYRFSQAYSACPSCIAARAGLMTGLLPARHGFVGYRDEVPWQYPTTLAGTFAAAGYHTQCVGKMHVWPRRNLLGFHNVVLHDGYLHQARTAWQDQGLVDDYLPWFREQVHSPYADYLDTGLGCNGYAVQPWPHHELLHPMAWVTTQSIDFLRRRDDSRPFFLKVSYHRPHPPLDPPPSCLQRYLDKPLPLLPLGDWVQHELPTAHGLDSPVPSRPDQVDLARRAYYAQLTHLDLQVNRLMMGLYEHQVFENTVVMMVADHGDMLYDHRLVAKALPFDGSARVPFLLRLPRQMWSTPGGGRVIDQPVELCDVFPTLCDATGVPVPAGLDGASVLPLCRGEDTPWRQWLHGEHAYGDRSNHWLTDGRWKYAWFSQTGRELLFDLAADPQECCDLSAAQPDRLAIWRERLIGELRERPEGYVAAGQLVVGRPAVGTLPHAGVGC